jgi:hypothetical protein
MSKKDAESAKKIAEAANTVGRYINAAYLLHGRLLDQVKNTKVPLGKQHEANLPVGVWCTLARWDKNYRDAWIALGSIRELLARRWGSSQGWIDQSRGDVYSVAVPFLAYSFHPNWGTLLRSAYAALLDIDLQRARSDEKWSNAYRDRVKLAEDTKSPMFDDPVWNKVESDYLKEGKELSNKQQQQVEPLAGHPLVLNIFATMETDDWTSDFFRRLTAIERVAATLLAAASDESPNIEAPKFTGPLEGEWSLPMSKTELMTRVKLKPDSFNTFAKQHGLRKCGRQLFQMRLDQMDSATRRRIETGKAN